MQRQITVSNLLDALRERLKIRVITGEAGLHNVIFDAAREKGGHIIAGPLNYIHPTPIQIIGPTEKRYFTSLPAGEQATALERLFAASPAAILVTNRQKPMPALERRARESGTPLLASPLSDSLVLDNLQYYAARFLAAKTTLHGVFLEVLGMGVLLTGHAAVGKSELALELITRGHRLVADDVPEFRRIAPDIVTGNCPPLLREFLEVRGLGILDIRAMFGDNAIVNSMYLQLIIHLKRMKLREIADMDRLQAEDHTRTVLGVEIPQITVPVAPGRNLAILVETAVRNHMLKLKGYDAAELFIERQRKAIEEATP
jgi:HPr kinase/phosphorylase